MKAPLVFLSLLVVLTAAFVGPGCGTIYNQGRHPPRPYGGVVAGFTKPQSIYGPAAFPLMLFDLPFNIVGDTFILPFDIYATASHTSANR